MPAVDDPPAAWALVTPTPHVRWMGAMLKGFKDFLLRGNVVDLAVAVVIGAAFTAWSPRSPRRSSSR